MRQDVIRPHCRKAQSRFLRYAYRPIFKERVYAH